MRLDQEKIQPALRTQLLHPVDEKVIRVQLVGHDQIVNTRHVKDFGDRTQRVNLAGKRK